MTPNRVLSFRLSEQLFAIDVNSIVEVRPVPRVTSIPEAPPSLLGFTEVQGQLLCVFDPRPGLDLPPLSPEQASMSIVVATQEGPITLLVDEIGDVLEVSAQALERPPATMSKKARALIRHICQREDELLFVLNPNQLALAS
jgi:purine-binding chemotaxis protein CheW